MNEHEMRRLSKESFKTKLKKAKTDHQNRLKVIEAQYKADLSISKNKNETNAAKKRRKLSHQKEKNKYALRHNSLVTQELYRKGVLEAKIEHEKNKYRKNKRTKIKFDNKKEKEKLDKKIELLKMKYEKPISTKLRRQRNLDLHEGTSFIKVPVNTFTKATIRTILLIFLAALLTTLALDIFVKPFGIYSAGLRGITQMFYYLIKNFKSDITPSMSYLLFFLANIPLAIFGYFKVGKRFTILTISFIVIQFLISLACDYSGLMEHIKPFGKTSDDIYKIVVSKGSSDPLYRYVLPFISTIIGAIIYGIGVGLVYRVGGSTGGSKFVVTYISAKKNKSIGTIAIGIGVFVIALGITVNHILIAHKPIIKSYFSATLFASIIFTFVSNMTLDKMFAKTKKQKLTLVTTKKEEVIKFLDLQMLYNRSFIMSTVKTGISSKPKYQFTFIATTEEAKLLPEVFKQIDKDAFCTLEKVDKVVGKFYNTWFQ